MTLFDVCPRCRSLGSRFDMKLTMSYSGDPDYVVLLKEMLGDWDGKRLCTRCYRKLSRKESSIFLAYHLSKVLVSAFRKREDEKR